MSLNFNKLFQNNEKPKETSENNGKKNESSKEAILTHQRNVGALLRNKIESLNEEYENTPTLQESLEGESDEQATGKIKEDVVKEIRKVQKKLNDVNEGIRFVDKHHDQIVYPENSQDN